VFEPVKDTVAAWAAQAKNITIAGTAKVLVSFITLFRNASGKRDMAGWEFKPMNWRCRPEVAPKAGMALQTREPLLDERYGEGTPCSARICKGTEGF
jgi:hypothetical protein